jgi:hypothetical protein
MGARGVAMRGIQQVLGAIVGTIGLMLLIVQTAGGAAVGCASGAPVDGGDDDDDDDDDDDFVPVECDQDRDGFDAAGAPCNGDDCHDGDETVHPGAITWQIEEVTDGVGCTESLSVAEDSQGVVHIACVDDYEGALMHFYSTDDGWKSEVVVGFSDTVCSIAATEDEVAIAYLGPGYGVMLARLSGGEWSSEEIDTDNACGWSVVLRADADGVLHLAYGCSEIRYANSEGGWEPELLTSLVRGYRYGKGDLDMAVDTTGAAHIGFRRSDTALYLTNSSGEWDLSEVYIPGVGTTHEISVTVHDDRPELEINAGTKGSDWYHATPDDSEWVIERGQGVRDYTIAADGTPHGCGNSGLYCSAPENEDWRFSRTTDDFSIGSYDCAIDVGSNGAVHIVGDGGFWNELMYATLARNDSGPLCDD